MLLYYPIKLEKLTVAMTFRVLLETYYVWQMSKFKLSSSYEGTVTGYYYCQHVIIPHLHLLKAAIGENIVFMDGNLTPRQQLLQKICWKLLFH